MRSGLSLIIGLSFVVGGCGSNDIPAPVLSALESTEQYELLSLDPTRSDDLPADHFHGWRVLGRTSIADTAKRKVINDALRAGVKANDGTAVACFDPRHGIRAIRGENVTELVICFECFQVQVFNEGKKAEAFFTSASPQPAFDQVLRDAGVTLGERPK